MGLFAVLLPALGILVALSVNAAYMELSRTELIVATDVSAHAGGRALSEYQNLDSAIAAAAATAALNNVAGKPLVLSTSDGANQIEFGRTNQANGDYVRFNFQKVNHADIRSGAQRASAVRITASRTSGSPSGPINMIFPHFLTTTKFEPTFQSVAMQVDRDISLVIDRSGSMGDISWDWPSGKSPTSSGALNGGVAAGILTKSGNTYYYRSGQNQTTYYTWVWEQYYKLGPAPKTPWSDLLTAVDSFLTVLNSTPQEELVSLSSYSSTGSVNCQLTGNYNTVKNSLNALNPSGNTAIGLGMQAGIQPLINTSFARPQAAKTMVVMTDGIHNTGTSPVTVANTLVAQYPVRIFTVTFGADADISRMQQVATIGGGKHYHAATGAQLNTVFQEIANNVATLLTQ